MKYLSYSPSITGEYVALQRSIQISTIKSKKLFGCREGAEGRLSGADLNIKGAQKQLFDLNGSQCCLYTQLKAHSLSSCFRFPGTLVVPRRWQMIAPMSKGRIRTAFFGALRGRPPSESRINRH